MNRVHNFKLILWIITGFAAAAAVTRYWFGLGAVTNLSDATPWGLWIGFDVVSGVALAAGGFVITAAVYIMKRKEFYPIVRPAVLTAMLGYMAVVVGLLFDLGLPWNLWQPIIHWQYHSALFEVAMCVMFYLAVLILEFAPIPLEEIGWFAKIRNFLVKMRIPLVILGIMLSTLHQSSLGSLFLLTHYKLHPLWWTSLLPVLFFISAVGLGLMMVTFESLLTSYLYRRKPELSLLSKLGKAAIWVIALYLVVRLSDIALNGKFGLIFAGSWENRLFISELLIAFIIPLILLAIPKVRSSVPGLWVCAIMVVAGTVYNRINVSGLAMQRTVGFYLPAWTEIVISAGVVSIFALLFFFFIEKCAIWESRPSDPEAAKEIIPRFDHPSEATLGDPHSTAWVKYSLAFIIAMAVCFAFLPGGDIRSKGSEPAPVHKARGGGTLFVDGNRDHFGVYFAHKLHEERNGGENSCALCHHMNIPLDENSGCYECHFDMYSSVDAFKHDWHASPDGVNLSCDRCHIPGENRTAASANSCAVCHTDLFPDGATIEVVQYQAASYTGAMHGLCIDCHRVKAMELEGKAYMAYCAFCHDQQFVPEGFSMESPPVSLPNRKWVVVPMNENK